MNAKGTLFVVATPIGNMSDLSPRAREVLEAVEIIACEDTRHTGLLLSRAGVSRKTLRPFHDHNERASAPDLVGEMVRGNDVALVSDAGTPTISDPGYRLVDAALSEGMNVVSVPGPSSVIAAISISGLPTDRFAFEGFLPSAAGRRGKRLAELAREGAGQAGRTLVFLESARRVATTLELVAKHFGPVRCAVCREMTKLHEEVVRGEAGELAAHFTAESPRGEVVLVVDTRSVDSTPEVTQEPSEGLADYLRRAEALVGDGVPRAEAIRILVSEGCQRSKARAAISRAIARSDEGERA